MEISQEMKTNNQCVSKCNTSTAKTPHHIALQLLQRTPLEVFNIFPIVEELFGSGITIVTLRIGTGAVTADTGQTYAELLSQLQHWSFLQDNQVKLTFLGRWYTVSDTLIEQIKKVTAATQDYDKKFLTICMNYDGQEEITDACRLIAKQVRLGKITPEEIDAETIKQNMYSSYFVPPELIIVEGSVKGIAEDSTKGSFSLQGLLLWDSAQAVVKEVSVLTKETLAKNHKYFFY